MIASSCGHTTRTATPRTPLRLTYHEGSRLVEKLVLVIGKGDSEVEDASRLLRDKLKALYAPEPMRQTYQQTPEQKPDSHTSYRPDPIIVDAY